MPAKRVINVQPVYRSRSHMAEFTRLTACEADTELREMRQLMLKQVADLERDYKSATKTTLRIQAINRALQSLAAEKGEQGQLLSQPPIKRPASRKPNRSPYSG